MKNKEWLEVHLTQNQIDILEQCNIISDTNASYVLGLGQFYKVLHSDDPYLQKYYIASSIELLPEIVLQAYKEILEGECGAIYKLQSNNFEKFKLKYKVG